MRTLFERLSGGDWVDVLGGVETSSSQFGLAASVVEGLFSEGLGGDGGEDFTYNLRTGSVHGVFPKGAILSDDFWGRFNEGYLSEGDKLVYGGLMTSDDREVLGRKIVSASRSVSGRVIQKNFEVKESLGSAGDGLGLDRFRIYVHTNPYSTVDVLEGLAGLGLESFEGAREGFGIKAMPQGERSVERFGFSPLYNGVVVYCGGRVGNLVLDRLDGFVREGLVLDSTNPFTAEVFPGVGVVERHLFKGADGFLGEHYTFDQFRKSVVSKVLTDFSGFDFSGGVSVRDFFVGRFNAYAGANGILSYKRVPGRVHSILGSERLG